MPKSKNSIEPLKLLTLLLINDRAKYFMKPNTKILNKGTIDLSIIRTIIQLQNGLGYLKRKEKEKVAHFLLKNKKIKK